MMGLEEIIHGSLEKLQKLGLDALDAEENIVKQFRSVPDEIMEDMDSEQIIGRLLGELHFYLGTEQTALGMYSFDVEMEEIKQMYTGFLENMARISGGDLKITGIEEEIAEEVLESGTGTQTVRFCCNGKTYEYEARTHYDWFDAGMLSFMNRVIEEQHTGRSLFVTGDGYQECIVFYRTQEWAEQFEHLLGVELERP